MDRVESNDEAGGDEPALANTQASEIQLPGINKGVKVASRPQSKQFLNSNGATSSKSSMAYEYKGKNISASMNGGGQYPSTSTADMNGQMKTAASRV